MKVKSFALMALLVLSLALSSCANNKKKTTEGLNDASPDSIVDNGTKNGILEVNGDSDSNRAGGLQTVYFDFNSAGISGTTKETLASNAEFLKKNASVKVQVEGHADERGSVQFNLALGEKRAKTVRDFLISAGITSNRLSVISMGKEKPVSFGHDEESWSKNRRANFVVTEK